MKPLAWRIIMGIVIFFSALIAPWWIVLILCLAGLFFFDSYYEMIVAGFFIDCLYSSENFFSKITFTLCFGLLFLFIFFLKKQLKFY